MTQHNYNNSINLFLCTMIYIGEYDDMTLIVHNIYHKLRKYYNIHCYNMSVQTIVVTFCFVSIHLFYKMNSCHIRIYTMSHINTLLLIHMPCNIILYSTVSSLVNNGKFPGDLPSWPLASTLHVPYNYERLCKLYYTYIKT